MSRVYGFDAYGDSSTEREWQRGVPVPGPSEVLVEVRAAGVNPVDAKIRAGYLQEFMPVDLPSPLGSEVSGVVRAVGSDVDGFAEGDEVFGAVAPGSGAFAEHAVLSAASTAAKPVQVSWTDAAVLAVAAATAADGLAQLGLTRGEVLLVNGIGGGVGIVAAQLARNAGVTVVGTASESKRALAETYDAIFMTSGDGLDERVRQVLPDGVDAVLDCVGGAALSAVVPLAKDPARVVSAAAPVTVAALGGVYVERRAPGPVLAELAALVAAGELTPHVTDVRPLDEAGEAMASVESGHARGKTVLVVG